MQIADFDAESKYMIAHVNKYYFPNRSQQMDSDDGSKIAVKAKTLLVFGKAL